MSRPDPSPALPLTLFRTVPYLRRFHGWTGKSAYVAAFRVFHVTEQLEQEIRTLRSLFWSDRDPEGLAFAPLADAYRRAGQFRQAVELLANGRIRHPAFATGHVVAARVFLERGLLEEGELAARRALELDEDNVLALGLLADVLDAKGETLDAGSLRARVHELAPDEAADAEEPVMDIAELAPDEPADVEEPILDIAELAPDEPADAEEPILDIAELAPDEPADVEEPVLDIAELAPDEPADAEEPDYEDDGMLVTRTLADLYARQGFSVEALEVYRQLLEIDPHDEELRRKVKELESASGEEAEAEDQGVGEVGSPELAALDDDEPVEHVWQTQAQAEGHDVDTPFAWIDEESDEPAAATPPISEYFRRLLAWEPGYPEAGTGEDDRAEGPVSGDGGGGLTTSMDEERP